VASESPATPSCMSPKMAYASEGMLPPASAGPGCAHGTAPAGGAPAPPEGAPPADCAEAVPGSALRTMVIMTGVLTMAATRAAATMRLRCLSVRSSRSATGAPPRAVAGAAVTAPAALCVGCDPAGASPRRKRTVRFSSGCGVAGELRADAGARVAKATWLDGGLAEPGSGTAPRAAMNASASAQRSSGSLRSARSMTTRSPAGVSGRTSAMAGRSSCFCL
jgi:hypothetical protein